MASEETMGNYYNLAQGGPLLSDHELNQRIIEMHNTVGKIMVPFPKFKKKKVAIIIKDENGEPVLNENGIPLAEETEQEVFQGFEDKIMEYPVPEIFTHDLPLSNLLETEVKFIRDGHALYAYALQEYIYNKDPYVFPLLCHITTISHSLEGSSRGRHFGAVEMAKSMFAKGQAESNVNRFRYEEELHKQGVVSNKKNMFTRR